MSELDYNLPKTIQNEIDHTYDIELTPHNSIIQGNNLIFQIESGTDFTDLGNTFLSVELKMLKSDNANVANTDNCGPVNNIFHSIWSQVSIKLKDTVISHPSPNYAYRAYLENLLNYSQSSKETWMTQLGWYFDEANKFDQATNTALATRRSLVTDKKILKLKGKLSTDIGNQPLLIPSHTDITITLTPARGEFAIQNFDNTTSFNIHIISAKLHVKKVKLFPSKIAEFEKNIAKAPIRLPINQVRVDSVSIPSGLASYHHNSLFSGQLPNYLIVGLIANKTYAGDASKNPFNFVNANLNHIQLKVNEILVPTYPISPDFTTGNVVEAYESLFHVLGRKYDDWSNGLTLSDFINGSTLIGFVVNNDSHCRHDENNLHGLIDITLKFKRPLEETMSMIVYSSTQGTILIDRFRNVLLDI